MPRFDCLKYYVLLLSNTLQRTESTESGNDAVLGTSPGTNWRRRNADSTERIDVSMELRSSGRRESLVCTRITQPVAIISFTGKLGDREVYCGKCVSKFLLKFGLAGGFWDRIPGRTCYLYKNNSCNFLQFGALLSKR